MDKVRKGQAKFMEDAEELASEALRSRVLIAQAEHLIVQAHLTRAALDWQHHRTIQALQAMKDARAQAQTSLALIREPVD